MTQFKHIPTPVVLGLFCQTYSVLLNWVLFEKLVVVEFYVFNLWFFCFVCCKLIRLVTLITSVPSNYLNYSIIILLSSVIFSLSFLNRYPFLIYSLNKCNIVYYLAQSNILLKLYFDQLLFYLIMDLIVKRNMMAVLRSYFGQICFGTGSFLVLQHEFSKVAPSTILNNVKSENYVNKMSLNRKYFIGFILH